MDNRNYNNRSSGSQSHPLRMSDGRFISNYTSSRELTDQLQKKFNVRNIHDYIKFQSLNGDKLMKMERDKFLNTFDDDYTTHCCDGWSG